MLRVENIVEIDRSSHEVAPVKRVFTSKAQGSSSQNITTAYLPPGGGAQKLHFEFLVLFFLNQQSSVMKFVVDCSGSHT